MTSLEVIQRLDQLGKSHPIVKACWEQMIRHNLSYEQFLALCVVMLAEQNEQLWKITTKQTQLQPPPPMLVQCGGNACELLALSKLREGEPINGES